MTKPNMLLFLFILFIIFITIIAIYNYSNISAFKLRRSIPLQYYTGDIYGIYGAIGNPNILRKNHPFSNDNVIYKAPDVSLMDYGQNAPYVNHDTYGLSASAMYNSLY